MAVSFKVPAQKQKSLLTIDTFLGVDFTNSPANVSENRSPSSINMIRSVPGKVRKCMGYHLLETYPDQINGFHTMGANTIIHAGTVYYLNDPDHVLYSTGKDALSKSWQFGSNLYILDGLKMLVFNGTTLTKVESGSYIPTFSIGKPPAGGGTEYEPLNLLQPGFIELFAGTVSATAYQLSFEGLDATRVTARKLVSEGTWTDLAETTNFTVDRTNGIITFLVAPGVSPISGEDNVEIKAYKTVSGYSDRINKCDIGIPYGVNGMQDRLFVSGNADFKNQDWFSQQYDPTYFGDTNYSALGSARSGIVCYSIINNYLAAHKDSLEQEQNIIIRSGNLVDNKPAFPATNSLRGTGAIAKHSVAYLATEPLFLTNEGIYAITAQDLTGEKYSQNRSFFLNGKLLAEANKENAVCCVFDNMYYLAINGVMYILDGDQPVQTDKSMPYSTRQYAGFYRENVDARVLFTNNDILYFGNDSGEVYAFYTDVNSSLSYSDNGAAIKCTWETPDIDGNLFYKNKTIRFLAVRLQSAVSTSMDIFVNEKSLWSLIKSDSTSARYFDFANINFAKWTFSTDTSQKIVSTKVRVKKVNKVRFMFSNDSINEPFGLFNVAIEYVEGGNYKGG